MAGERYDITVVERNSREVLAHIVRALRWHEPRRGDPWADVAFDGRRYRVVFSRVHDDWRIYI